MSVLERGLAFLGWQGGTIWQVEDALIKRLNKDCEEWEVDSKCVFERVNAMLELLGAM